MNVYAACPFCGKSEHARVYTLLGGHRAVCETVTGGCGAAGPPSKTSEGAAVLWNTRAAAVAPIKASRLNLKALQGDDHGVDTEW
jgi:hypothetical protein